MPCSSSPSQQDNPAATCEGALLEEFAAIIRDGDLVNGPPSRTCLTALCLSGGGIRSAAFCLGALQALAKKGVLGEFNYLSTVSGGGYIGAWLTTIMHGATANTPLKAATKALTKGTDPALRSLRNYTNFLIPDGGFGSSETWTAIVLWLRNVLLNWLVFGPILLAAAIVPVLYQIILCDVSCLVGNIALALGFACMLAGTIMVCRFVPTHAYGKTINRCKGPYGTPTHWIQLGVVGPFLAWAFLAPVWFRSVALNSPDFMPHPFIALPIGAFIIPVAGYWIAAVSPGRTEFPAFFWNALFWIAGAALSAFLLWVGANLGQQSSATTLAVLAPLWVIGVQVLHSTIYVGLRWTAAYAELDREWLARLNGEKLVPILSWSALAAAALMLPILIIDNWYADYVAVVGFASGPFAALIGRSAKTVAANGTATNANSGPRRTGRALGPIVTIATLLFAATLFMLLGRLGAVMVCQFALNSMVPAWGCALIIIGLLAIVSFYCGGRININRFSMHGVYRNRLARAFIGTARPPAQRRPDDYTRFDPGDNLRVQELYKGKDQKGILFPIVNVTLNLTEGTPNSWAERKAAPFTITPLRCGAACLGRALPDDIPPGQYVRTDQDDIPPGRYVRTDQYAGNEADSGSKNMLRGITLGTAMTISGAAVSPDMGYHSSPATSFLMTLFDVRLGAWLPNPGIPQSWNSAKPDNAIWPLFNEMFGRANDKKANIYLSDGGHFDNLGLYEMLRRQCGLIVVIDASADRDYCYDDLGRTVRMASIDLDVTVNFIRPVIKGGHSLANLGALADITYHNGTKGRLLYLKPWLPENLPAGVLAYWAAHDEFPHQSTADQFFQESQFESYRALGERIVGDAFAAAPGFPIHERLRSVLEPAPPNRGHPPAELLPSEC